MKRTALVFALLLCASPSFAQGLSAGDGLRGTKPNNRLSTIPADQFLTQYYAWTSAPGAAGAGWTAQQTTAGGVTLAARTPFLEMTGATANRRCLIWEEGMGAALSGYTNVSSGGEITLAVSLYGLDGVAATTTGWFQLAYGDSTNFIVSKVPSAGGFGIIVSGSTNANNAYALANAVTAYVSSGADTTYAPFPTVVASLTTMKLFIHADPSSGAVQFWANDVLQCTITSPARSAVLGNSLAIWENGAAGFGTIAVGPLTIQRAWP